MRYDLHLLGMFNPEQIKSQRQRPRNQFAEHQSTISRRFVTLKHRAILEERVEFRRKLVEISAEKMRFKFA
jgi:hypothetical protein